MALARHVRQTAENLQALMRHYGLPVLEIDDHFAGRTYFKGKVTKFFETLQKHKNFIVDNKVKLHGPQARKGVRESIPSKLKVTDRMTWPRAQFILHGKEGVSDVRLEGDFDTASPGSGLLFALFHLVADVIGLGKLDPFQIREALIRRGVEVPLIGEKEKENG